MLGHSSPQGYRWHRFDPALTTSITMTTSDESKHLWIQCFAAQRTLACAVASVCLIAETLQYVI